jgi:hypothetical protein
MLSAAESRSRAARASDRAESISGEGLKAQYRKLALNWIALAELAESLSDDESQHKRATPKLNPVAETPRPIENRDAL